MSGFRPPQWQQPQKTSITVTLPQQNSDASQGNPSPTTFFFDAVFRVDHSQQMRITQHPVQNGASIVDHAYSLPAVVILEIGMSDCMDRYQAGQYTSSASKSVSAYQAMKYLERLRLPITLSTRLDTYGNMLIENVSSSDTVRTLHGLRMTIRLQQITLGTVATNTISARPDQTSNTDEGTKSSQQVPPSLQNLINNTGNWPTPQWNSNTKPN